MSNPPPTNFFDLLIDFNCKLCNGWAAFWLFPLSKGGVDAFFRQATIWTALIEKCLQLQFAALPALEPMLKQSPVLNEASADAILADIEQSIENPLPVHNEFDTLIYPWHEAEKPAPELPQRIYHHVAKVA